MRIKKSKKPEVEAFNEAARKASAAARPTPAQEAQARRTDRARRTIASVAPKPVGEPTSPSVPKWLPDRAGVEKALESEPVQDEVVKLFLVPFWHLNGYIYDVNSNTAASWSPIEPRGWGRIQYMPNAGQLFEAWASTFRRIAGDSTDHDAVAKLLTEHWIATHIQAIERLAEMPPSLRDAVRSEYIEGTLTAISKWANAR